jgi:hypothetical protein
MTSTKTTVVVSTPFTVKGRTFIELDRHACQGIVKDGRAMELLIDEDNESVTLRPIVKRSGDDIDE